MIKIVFEPDKKRSAAYDDGKEIGECTYSASDNLWIINHTFVDDGYGGQGIAGKLVEELVKQARVQKMEILPLCSFAHREFRKKKEYADVLHPY